MEHGGNNNYKKIRKLELVNEEGLCPYCPFHGGENSRRWIKRGTQKPKYKNINRSTVKDLPL